MTEMLEANYPVHVLRWKMFGFRAGLEKPEAVWEYAETTRCVILVGLHSAMREPDIRRRGEFSEEKRDARMKW